jgi:archaellum component FlaD/FlaE
MVDQASGQSPMKEEFEQVDLHGVSHTNISPPLPERPVVMEDLERTYSLDTEKGLKGEVEDVLKEQHLDGITSSVEESIKLESNEMKTAVGSKSPNESEETERDDFHSVPTTPMEAITVN